MNEEDFVDYLKKEFHFSEGTGIGDDCSVTFSVDHFQLITTDMLIENVHYDLRYFTLREVAIKSVAVNLSDIASMGGIPKYFYLSAGFPEILFQKGLKEFFDGIKESCKKWDVELAGGDFSKSEKLVVSITMVGESENPVLRSSAKNGDLVGITGVTGESYLGLELLKKGLDIPRFTEKHKNIFPEIEKGLVLKNYANSMIDISDGLVLDLRRILKASGLNGCNIYYEKIPVDKGMRTICKKECIDEYKAVLSGGEDFVLLFTIQKEQEVRLRSEGIKYHIIGKIDGKNGIQVSDNGNPVDFYFSGFDHFQI